MNAVLWREFRLMRPVLVAGSVVLLAPYLFTWAVVATNAIPERNMLEAISVANVYSLLASQILLAVLGGGAFANERVDRSAEFIAYLPVSRSRRILSKSAVPLLAVACMWGAFLFIGGFFTPLRPDGFHSTLINGMRIRELLAVFVTGLTFFCSGWFLSSFRRESTLPVLGGLLTPVAILLLLEFAYRAAPGMSFRSGRMESIHSTEYIALSLVVSALCFAAGCRIFLRRVEP